MARPLRVDPGPITTLTVDRPDKLNSLTVATLERLAAAIDDARDEARVLILTGAGDDAFIAGADISYMQSLEPSGAQEYSELGHEVAQGLESFPGPTVAALNGYALGGGCELAIACDLRVASERAVIGQPEIDLGIFPGWGGTQRLPRLVGDEMARRLIYFGERVDAQDANEIGLVGEVVAHDELDSYVADMAEELAAKPRLAMQAAKEALNLERHGDPEAGLTHERRAWSGLFGTADQREGMAAFLEDREPDFE
jgi:enoyl-CoA hydratase/carnithine racemase